MILHDTPRPGFVVWLTGLSGAGKTTLAHLLEKELRTKGGRVEVLDGDVVRRHLGQELGFSKSDRDTNVRRIGYVSQLLCRNGVVAIAAAISPYREVRNEIRTLCAGRFVEVYVKCNLQELYRRDVKGLYRKALAGELQNLSGVSDPYEEPLHAEVVLETDHETPDESRDKLLKSLQTLGYV
jgi:adenylyl-sulfate kinase